MNLLERLAYRILKKYIEVDKKNVRELEAKLAEATRNIDSIRYGVDNVDVKVFRDMYLTKEETLFLKNISKTTTFATILDKLTMRLVYTITGRQSPTVEDLQFIAGQRAAYSFILDVITSTKRGHDTVNSLTGEVKK